MFEQPSGKRTLSRSIVLIVAVGTLVLISLLVAWRAFQIQDEARARLAGMLELYRLTAELKYRAADVNRWQGAYILDAARGDKRALDDQSPGSRRQFLQISTDLEALFRRLPRLDLTVSERRALRSAHDYFRAFMNHDGDIVNALRRGRADPQVASAAAIGAGTDRFRNLVAVIDDLLQSIRSRSVILEADTDAAMRAARELLIYAGGLAVLLVATLAAMLTMFLRRNADLVGRLNDLALTDPLTGIANRRAWDEALEVELARSLRLDYQVGVALLDLDHFKRFNDERGHPAGDRLLQEATFFWREALRREDFIARYGGEEFALILPGCDLEKAGHMIERLRPLVPDGQTFSAGVARWDGYETPYALMARVDEALYQAKERGRNQSAFSDPTASEAFDRAQAAEPASAESETFDASPRSIRAVAG
jgi:diguanylate cyclase (GGDEF)-like protein